MNTLVIVLLALAVAAQATPYLGDYGSGRSYGGSDYGSGRRGILDRGYGNHVYRQGHDIGRRRNDFDASIHHHQSGDHDIGGVLSAGSGGRDLAGYGGYGQGRRIFGRGYRNGIL